jgi:hypothetical protein
MTTLTIVRGTTFPVTLRLTNPAGVAVDLTGKQLVFVAATTEQMVKKTGVGGSGFTITDAAAGLASLTFTVAETRAMTPSKFVFTIELWESSGATQTLLLEGFINMRNVENRDD